MVQNNIIAKDYRILVMIIGALFLILFSIACFRQPFQEQDLPGSALELTWKKDQLSLGSPQDHNGQTSLYPVEITPFFTHKIPVNRADSELLQTISGIGPELAGRIVMTREKEGLYYDANDLLKINGIGLKRKNQLEAQLSFE